jgi:hypothetical protein
MGLQSQLWSAASLPSRAQSLYQAVDQLRFQMERVSSYPEDINKPSEQDDCPRKAAIPQGPKALGAAR